MLHIKITNNLSHPKRPEYGNYDYEVFVNDKVIASGSIENHLRDLGWPELVERLLEAHNNEGNERGNN